METDRPFEIAFGDPLKADFLRVSPVRASKVVDRRKGGGGTNSSPGALLAFCPPSPFAPGMHFHVLRVR